MEYVFNVDKNRQGEKLAVFLRQSGVSLALIKKIKFSPDGITVNGVKQNTNYLVQEGDSVAVKAVEENITSTVVPQNGPLDIVYMDDCCMVVNKPRDMPVHPSFNHFTDTLANYFAGYWQNKGQQKICRVINRLDRNTSGLVLIALDQHSARILGGKTDKIYTAVATGYIDGCGIIDRPIARMGDSIITRCVSPEGQRAVTEYNIIKSGELFSVADIKLHTGRTHQIRVHFSHIGHPLAGDDLYGGSLEFINRQALHCRQLCFESVATGKIICVDSPLPQDMQKLADMI